MSDNAPANLDKYSNQFSELTVEERTSIIDLNAINPLSPLREVWQNTTTTQTEHKLSTAENTNDVAYLKTTERGQYTPGYQVQAGQGIRIPSKPTGDSTIRWGYYTVDSNGEPIDGYYFGVDSTDVFVARVRDGVTEKVYKDNWNRDILDGNGGDGPGPNPSDVTLDLSDGLVFQIEFVYYGYGTVEMQILVDEMSTDEHSSSEIVTAHVFQPDGETSITNTNLPIRQDIVSGGTNNDAFEMYVGGRQFSIIGEPTTNNRKRRVGVDALSVDDTQWYPAISVQVKDGSGGANGDIDFRHVLSVFDKFEVITSDQRIRWAIRRNTQLTGASFQQSPDDIDDDEIALKYDTSATDANDGSGNVTGSFLDGGRIQPSKKNESDVDTASFENRITNGQIFTLCFRAVDGQSMSTLNDIVLKWDEKW